MMAHDAPPQMPGMQEHHEVPEPGFFHKGEGQALRLLRQGLSGQASRHQHYHVIFLELIGQNKKNKYQKT